MGTLLGLAAAVTYGSADFVGGLVTKRAGAVTVVVVSQLTGLVLLVCALPLLDVTRPAATTLAWGAAAGVAGGGGVGLLYRALAVGTMSLVAPLTAVEAAALPVLFGLVAGERPSALALAGVAVALLAIALVSSASGGSQDGHGRPWWARPGFVEAVGAGLAFGAFFILLDQAASGGAVWPLVAARVTSVLLFGGAALAAGRTLRPVRGTGAAIALAGALDMVANLLYLLALQRGLLSLVAVLVSLYPASTVLLARLVLGERLGRGQLAGLACAAGGVAGIAAG